MKLIAAPLMAIALAAPSQAGVPAEKPLSGPGTRYFAGPPPPRFQHDTMTVVLFTSDVARSCGKEPPPEGFVILGCTLRDPATGNVLMVLPNPCRMTGEGLHRHIACHEIGHVNGWGSYHER